MRTVFLAIVALAIEAWAYAVRAQNPAPLLPSTPPLRRLGASEFRLPLRDGRERAFAFSRDGGLLAGCNGKELRVWTFPDGEMKHDLSAVIDTNEIVFSGDGRELLALEWRGRGERAIVRFNAHSGKRIRSNPLDYVRQDGSTNFNFLDHGRWVCSSDNRRRLAVWDGMTGRLMLLKPGTSALNAVASDDVLTVTDGTSSERIDLKTGSQLTRFRGDRNRAAAIGSADGTLMAGYSTDDEAIVFWKTDTNESVGAKIPLKEGQWRAAYPALSHDGRRIVLRTGEGSPSEPKCSVFDVETGALVCNVAPPGLGFSDGSVISPDGKWMFFSSERCVFSPVDMETGEPLKNAPDHVQAIERLSFTPDGSTLIAGSKDQRRAWNVLTGEPGTRFTQVYHAAYVAAVDNERALTVSEPNGGLQLQEIATGKVERVYDLGPSTYLDKFQLAVDRKSFSAQTGATFRRWSVDSGEVLDEWTLPESRRTEEMRQFGRYSFGGFALDGRGLYRIDEDRRPSRLDDGSIDWGEYSLLLEDWRTHEVRNRLRLPTTGQIAVADGSNDRMMAAVVSDAWGSAVAGDYESGMTCLLVWDLLAPRERLRVVRRRPDFYSAFSHVAITRDGRLVASVRHQTQIELWRVDTGDLVQRFDAPMDVTALTFSDDGAILASGDLEGRICLWETSDAIGVVNPKKSVQFEPRTQ